MTGVDEALRFLLTAAEPSGDVIGAALIKAIRKRHAGAIFEGCGGPAMVAEGLTSFFPIDKMSVIGPADALFALRTAYSGASLLSRKAAENHYSAAIFIDSWTFSTMAAKRIKRAAPDLPLIKYVAPQFWGSRPKRTQILADLFDGTLSLFEFEVAPIEQAGGRVQFVGNPIFQTAFTNRGNGEAFRERHNLGEGPLLAVLPGSRRGEVTRLCGPFGEAVRLVQARRPDLRVVVPPAPRVDEDVRALTAEWSVPPIFVSQDEKYDAMAAANAALVASGTASTEVALQGTPMVVAYKVSPLTAFWVRRVITTQWACLINIASDCSVVPELIQEDCDPTEIARWIGDLMGEENTRESQLAAFGPAFAKLGVTGPPASELAADAILSWARKN